MGRNERILDALIEILENQPTAAFTTRELASILKLRGKQLKILPKILRSLAINGTIAELRGGSFKIARPVALVTGRLVLQRNGNGYIVSQKDGLTVWIKKEDIGNALPGDSVSVSIQQDKSEYKGKIVNIEERVERDIVGTLTATGYSFAVRPLDPVYHFDFKVADVKNAKVGDRVVIRLANWSSNKIVPKGEIIEVIGPADKPSLDTDVICRQFDLPKAFPKKVVREAETIASRINEPGKRLRLDDTFILTIDPANARDFDDAISLTLDDKKRRVLGVHIADITHFIAPGSALDAEAYERATSIYLVDKVIPMLPEQLSNGICSLRPGEERLCFSAFLTFDDHGRMVARKFAKTTITSKLRLTYEQTLEIIEGKTPDSLANIPPAALDLIKAGNDLAQQLRNIRFKAGALDIISPETEVLLDNDGRMTQIRLTPSTLAHQLIEEFMIAANEAVATELATRGRSLISRLHEPPAIEKIEELETDLAILGFKTGDLAVPGKLAHFLASTSEHPLRYSAHSLVLRSMKRAVYAADKSGHFGLAKQHYAHFTAPIRRYPDIILHRLLYAALGGEERVPATASYLKAAAEHSSNREQRADEASRALIEIKKFRFLQQQLDDNKPIIYDAVISRVARFGLFVDVTEIQMTGLVHESTMTNSFVEFDHLKETLKADGKIYRQGDAVRVFVSKVDFDQRRVDFVLEKKITKTDNGLAKNKPEQRRRRVKKSKQVKKQP